MRGSKSKTFSTSVRKPAKSGINSGIFSDSGAGQKMDKKPWNGNKGLMSKSVKVGSAASRAIPKKVHNGLR